MEELNEKEIVWPANERKSTEREPLLPLEDKQKTTLRLFNRG